MKKYESFTAEDFAKDEYFIRWVQDKDASARIFWENWMAENPGKKDEVTKAKQILHFVNFQPNRPARGSFSEVWEAIEDDIVRKQVNFGPPHKPKKNRKIWWQQPMSVAASLALFMIFSAWVYLLFFQNTKVVCQTAYGEIRTIVLPDSSVVKLNAHSVLSYEENWQAEKPREVWLEGEAFFSVTHRQNHQKFIVNTGQLEVEVLGTEFNVNTRREKTSVVLAEGSVKLGLKETGTPKNRQSLVMKPGEMIEVLPSSPRTSEQGLVKKIVDTELYTSWKDQQLMYRDMPVSEVVKALEDQFGTPIIIRDSSLHHHRFTGIIPLDDPAIFFKTLSRNFNVEVVEEKGKVIIR